MKKILLGHSRSKRDVNETNFTNVELVSKERVLPVDRITQTLDSYEEYLSEKDSSEIYRLIFTINPVCTNILFNPSTEIVYKEGSDECTCLNRNGSIPDDDNLKSYLRSYKGASETSISLNNVLTRVDAIKDTAFSHPEIGGFTYHCGVDIFNNHMLRNREFKVVNKLTYPYANFNTIRDYLRDAEGNIIHEKLAKITSTNVLAPTIDTMIHLYQVDEIRTYHESIHDNLVESDGWVGFINPVTMNIPNYVTGDTSITINKCMNNNKAGEFIDMYPDRSLYSFIPKYNKYRNRLEHNWDYFITYPYSADTGNTLVLNGMRCYFYDLNELSESYFAKGNSGETNFIVHLRTQIKNSFYKGSYVNFTFGDDVKTDVPVKVESIGINGNDTQHVFGVNFESLLSCLMAFEVDSIAALGEIPIRVRKNIRGADCKYYIRKFKCINKSLNSSINPLAFAENIYSDKIAQIVFNDDIVTSGLTDNLGRQISEVFLTVVKRNKGNNEWYNNGNYTADTVEFSHCFGKVSSGFDLSPDEEMFNVHYLTAENRNSIALEKDINDNFNEFFGDIVEFSPYTVEETILEDVYHRFNTVQRETVTSEYSHIYYDAFYGDDYDISQDSFEVRETELFPNSSSSYICNEGYYYKPHYRVKLREFDENVKQGSHIKMSFLGNIVAIDGLTYSGITSLPYGLTCNTDNFGNVYGDTIYLINPNTGERHNAEIISVSGPLGTEIKFKVRTAIVIEDYNVFKPNPAKPSSAYELNDGTGRYLWRDILPENKILYGDELYDSMFTNGAHYFHTGVNFYLKRQDPTGEYGLNVKEHSINLDVFTGASEGEFKEISFAEYKTEGENDIC